jgi:hypothetical protein
LRFFQRQGRTLFHRRAHHVLSEKAKSSDAAYCVSSPFLPCSSAPRLSYMKRIRKEKYRDAEQTKKEESTSEKIHKEQEIVKTVFEFTTNPAVNPCAKMNMMRVSASEPKITEGIGPIKAEATARGFIKKKHFRLKRIFFKTVRQENKRMISGGHSIIWTYFHNCKEFQAQHRKRKLGDTVLLKKHCSKRNQILTLRCYQWH